MDTQQALELLYDRSRTLQASIGVLEQEISRWLSGMEAHSEPKRIISFLQDRYTAQRDQIYELGKLAGQIEEFERRAEDRERLGQTQPLPTHEESTAPGENHLDWLSNVGTLIHQSREPFSETRENLMDWFAKFDQEPTDGADDLQQDDLDHERR